MFDEHFTIPDTRFISPKIACNTELFPEPTDPTIAIKEPSVILRFNPSRSILVVSFHAKLPSEMLMIVFRSLVSFSGCGPVDGSVNSSAFKNLVMRLKK